MERARLLDALASFPSGVVVVTAFDAADAPVGLTVSAFCSVSLDPPLVLVCVARDSQTLPAMERSGAFTVNVLAAGRDDLARTFATKSADKFTALDWAAPDGAGGPVLHRDTVAHLDCAVHRQVHAGDHEVFIGEVREAVVTPSREALVYHRRAFVSVS